MTNIRKLPISPLVSAHQASHSRTASAGRSSLHLDWPSETGNLCGLFVFGWWIINVSCPDNYKMLYLYLFLWIFQGFCKEFNLIHPFDSALCFVNIRCARRGVPPLAARPSPEKFFITVSMLGNIVLCIQHLSL